MANKKISAATAISTIAMSDMLPIAKSSDSTAYFVTLGQMTGIGGVMSLAAAVTAGATSVTLRSVPSWAASYGGLLVIDPGTLECEVRRPVISGNTATVSALTYNHAINDVVLWVQDTRVKAKWFGAKGDGTTDDSTAIARAIVQADALYTDVELGPEKYNLGTTGVTLTENTGLIGVRRSIAANEGTWLTYSGTGNAITIDGQRATNVTRRGIAIKNLTVECTGLVTSYGIWCDYATLFDFEGLYITGALTAGLFMQNSYNGAIRLCRFNSNVIGLHITVKNDVTDTVFSGQMLVEQCDTWSNTDAGIKLEQPFNTLAQLTFLRCHSKDNAYGAYIAKDHRSLWLGCHFETNTTNGFYTHTDVNHGPVLIGCFFNHADNVYAISDNGDKAVYQANEFYSSGTPATGYGIQVAGNDARIVDNTFRSTANSIVLEATAVRPKIGVNYFDELGAQIADSGADSVDWEGEIVLKSPILDLSGAATTQFGMVADRDLYLREAKIIYVTEASSADAGVVIGAGISSDLLKLFDYTTAINQAEWTVATPTYDSYFIDAGQIITFRSAGGKSGAGECIIELYFMPFSMI